MDKIPDRHQENVVRPYMQLCYTHSQIVQSRHGILFLSVAVSTAERQCSREDAFFHA